MKKILSLLLLGVSSVSLVACAEKPSDEGVADEVVDTSGFTNFETVEHFENTFKFADPDNIVKNIYLPDAIGADGNITWSSDNSSVLSARGFVTRTFKDEVVNLTAVAELGSTKHRMYYTVTVKAKPTSIAGLVEEAADDFEILENNYVDSDIMVLPRVTDINGVYINEWVSSDESVIDLDGNVYRGEKEKTVVLTAVFSSGSDLSTYVTSRSYIVTVGATSDDEPIVIDENDSRILRKVYVETKDEFLVATSTAQLKAGDAIIVKDGTYSAVNISITISGTEENPIFIFAENPGEAVFTGSTQIEVIADYVTISSLNFSNGQPATDKGVVVFVGDHLRLTNTLVYQFEKTGNDYKWVSLTGQYHQIDNNIFDGKATGGALLTIWREAIESQYHHIHNNQFLNFSDTGGANGYETIRIGTSDYSQSYSYVLVEDNLFDSVNGEIEIISIKAGRTIVRNNTFNECVGLVTARHGKNSLIEGNSFFCNDVNMTGGVRMYDGGHIVRNNYVQEAYADSESRGGIVIHSGVQAIGDTTTMNLQWTPYNILIEGNTIVDGANGLVFCGKYRIGGADIVFKNNLIEASTGGVIRADKYLDNMSFEGNYFYGETFLHAKSQLANASSVFVVPTGVIYSTAKPTLSLNEHGMSLHSTIGAQNLTFNDYDNTGVFWK